MTKRKRKTKPVTVKAWATLTPEGTLDPMSDGTPFLWPSPERAQRCQPEGFRVVRVTIKVEP